MRPTRVLPSSNCAPLQPAIPPWWASTRCAAALTSPPFRSMTPRGGPESLKAVNSGLAVAWMKSLWPFCSTDVTFTAAAARAAGAAAINAAARKTTCLLCIRFSFEVVPRTLTLPLRDTEVLAFLQRVEVARFVLADGHGELHDSREHPARGSVDDGLGDHHLVAVDPGHLAAVLADEVAQPDRPAAVLRILHHGERRGRAGDRHRELELIERPLLQWRLVVAAGPREPDTPRGDAHVLERVALADRRVDVDAGRRHRFDLVLGHRFGRGGRRRGPARRSGRAAASGGEGQGADGKGRKALHLAGPFFACTGAASGGRKRKVVAT